MGDIVWLTIFLLLLLFMLFLIYKVIVYIAKNMFTTEIKTEGTKINIKFKDWFSWNIQVNNEKGTAGGNIKFKYPKYSAFFIGVICLFLAYAIPKFSWPIMVIIFCSFAFYNFRIWYKNLHVLKSISELPAIVTKQITMHHKKIIAVVCGTVADKTHIPVVIVRVVFLLFTVWGAITYLLLWKFMPIGNSQQIQK